MSLASNEALDYLLPDDETFWRWEDGDVIAWAHGKTIAFREELLALLSALQSMGAPPMGAVLLLLAATRDNWREWDSESQTLQELLDALPDSEHAQGVLQTVLQGLDRVHALPADCRSSLDARIALVELVFERQQRELANEKVTREIIQALGETLEHQLVHNSHWGFSSARLLRDLMCLAGGLERVGEDTLRNRMRTGMDSLPVAADDIGAAEQVRSMLAELEGDSELRSLSVMVKRIMAALTLPRPVSHPDDLPMGGVSDISNRGNLDRLLLSELANDDLTMSVRIAMNEALYLRRETPPTSMPRRRAVLLESGLRSWGLPRLFATAVGLALASAESGEQAEVYRAVGASLAEVDFTQREGLIEHLQALNLDLSPADGWPLFCERAMRGSMAEPVLVTNSDVLADDRFQQALRDGPLDQFLIIAVDRDGALQLSQRTSRGLKEIRSAKLDLSELLESPEHLSSLRDDDWVQQLPQIFRYRMFPLRFSSNDRGAVWRVAQHGLFSITRDRRLLHWPEFSDASAHRSGEEDEDQLREPYGGVQIFDAMPSRSLVWADGRCHDDCVYAIVGEPYHLLQINLSGEPTCRVQPIPKVFGAMRHAVIDHGMLLVISNWQVDVFDLESLRHVRRHSVSGGPYWIRDRFFVHKDVWYSLGFDGLAAVFTQVLQDKEDSRYGRVVEMFHREGVEGPVVVTDHGFFLNGVFHDVEKGTKGVGDQRGSVAGSGPQRDGKEEASMEQVRHVQRFDLSLKPPLSVAAASRDGGRIVLQGAQPAKRGCVLLDLDTGKSQSISRPANPILPPATWTASRPVRTRIRWVGLDSMNRFTMRGRKGAVTLVVRNQRMVLEPSAAAKWPLDAIPLDRAMELAPMKLRDGPPKLRLRRAVFPSGATVLLDNRGLLHCYREDGGPQFTMVLSERVSGWATGNQIWGEPFFTAGNTNISDTHAYETIIAPFIDLLI